MFHMFKKNPSYYLLTKMIRSIMNFTAFKLPFINIFIRIKFIFMLLVESKIWK